MNRDEEELEFILSRDNVEFLKDLLVTGRLYKKVNEALKHPHIVKGKYETGKYILRISRDDAERILEHITREMMQFGFGKDGDFNEYGKRLDEYIDIFARPLFS